MPINECALSLTGPVSLKGLCRLRGEVFACGADMKNRFSYFKDGEIYFSADFGDLSCVENFSAYLEGIREMREALSISPEVVAYDPHPYYFSSKALELFEGAKRLEVQHHEAHIASVLAQSEAQEDIIGVSFDGTGFGSDGNLWGGEFFTVNAHGYKRSGHLQYMKMPGAEKAVKQPWRMAFGLLYSSLGNKLFDKKLGLLKLRSKDEYYSLFRALENNFNFPLTSSCGRLFDAVSSLLGITHEVSFEAEAAINLEKKAALVEDDAFYTFDITQEKGVYIAGYRHFIEALLADAAGGVAVERLARRFHNSIAVLIVEMCGRLRQESGIASVALSGGVFQNKILRALARRQLQDEGFRILEEDTVPINDLGICVGQTYAALRGAGAVKE
jgi:hydrogenase maturation protein HypF